MKQHLNEQEQNDMLKIQYTYETYLGQETLMITLNSGLWAKCPECVNTIRSSVAIIAEAPFFPHPQNPASLAPVDVFLPRQTGLDQPVKRNSECCPQPAVTVGERSVILLGSPMFVFMFQTGTGGVMNGERAPFKRASSALGDCSLGLLPRVMLTLPA